MVAAPKLRHQPIRRRQRTRPLCPGQACVSMLHARCRHDIYWTKTILSHILPCLPSRSHRGSSLPQITGRWRSANLRSKVWPQSSAESVDDVAWASERWSRRHRIVVRMLTSGRDGISPSSTLQNSILGAGLVPAWCCKLAKSFERSNNVAACSAPTAPPLDHPTPPATLN